MDAVDLIRKKRDGGRLSEKEIRSLIRGYVDGSVPDYQMAALLMAVFFTGMTPEETGFLTSSMIASGESITIRDPGGPLIDKHSTGGVGDKVSLVLAPLAAACGVRVPMMSGRSLGHTGGTLDKLESIPGYRTDMDADRFAECVRQVGYAMIGQSRSVVPADRKMYALRDVTATVESVPLIVSSIISKKCAEGAAGFVFDVKTGSGAFMKEEARARELALGLCSAAESLGKKAAAVITSMDDPLGRCIGNFLEVRESVQCLRDEGPEDLKEVVVRLTAWMLVLAETTTSLERAERICLQRLADGSAYERFIDNVRFQGGDAAVVESTEKGPRAAIVRTIESGRSGYVRAVDAYTMGMAATHLGAGRLSRDDTVLPQVGVELLKRRGDWVDKGEPICVVHAEDRVRYGRAEELVREAYAFSDEPAEPAGSLIREEICGGKRRS